MANWIYFVDDVYIKNTTVVTNNVDVKNILPLVRSAADMYTRTTMGTYFYKSMLTKFNTLPQVFTADELLLLDQIQPAVAWRAAADATIELSYQLKNKGVQTQSGDYSASPEYKAIMWVADHYEQKADFYESRLFKFLTENKALFADFTSVLNKDSTAKDACCGSDAPSLKRRIFFI